MRRITSSNGLGLVLATVLATGCMTAPHDGQRVGRRDEQIRFAGYHTTAGANIQIHAFNFESDAFEPVGPAVRASRTPISARVMDLTWYPWRNPLTLPDRYWAEGEQGHFARVQARASGDGSRWLNMTALEEDWLQCLGAHQERADDFARHCQALNSPEVTVCTEDFREAGARRGPCPRRTVDLLNTDDSSIERLPLPDRTVSHNTGRSLDRFRWRGDGASFVDVFDQSLASDLGLDYLHTRGAGEANYIRFHYPHPPESAGLETFDVPAIASGLSFPRSLPWRGAVSFRQYDRGQCSLVMGWQDLFDQILGTIDETVRDIAATEGVTARPNSNASFTPVLRSAASDAIHFFQRYYVSNDLGNMHLSFSVTGALIARGDTAVLQIEHLDVSATRINGLAALADAFGVVDVPAIERRIEDRARTIIPQRVANAVRSRQAEAGGAPIRRLHGRPDGVEFILVEEVDDPFFDLIDLFRPDLCRRPPASTQPPTSGLFTTLFDPPVSRY